MASSSGWRSLPHRNESQFCWVALLAIGGTRNSTYVCNPKKRYRNMLGSIISEAPNKRGVYALCAGHGRNRYVAYVGITKNIRRRFLQHLVRRDSSVVTGASAVSLNPDKVTEVRWWVHPLFDEYLAEAEVVAFRVLNAALRSRQKISPPVDFIANRRDFAQEMEKLFSGPPSGSVKIPTFQELVRRVTNLEETVAEIRTKPAKIKKRRRK